MDYQEIKEHVMQLNLHELNRLNLAIKQRMEDLIKRETLKQSLTNEHISNTR